MLKTAKYTLFPHSSLMPRIPQAQAIPSTVLFAVARCEGRSLDDSIRFANAAAALSVQKLGAQGGMPYLKDVERMLGECKK